MADTSGRNIIGARRVPSSTLSEDYYTFLRSGAGPGPGPGPGAHGSHSLRPAESRFSLRDQFATTRREIEFGFDDTSSVLERSTIASEADLDNDFDDTVVVNGGGGIESCSLMPPPPRPFRSSHTHRTHYELLCLPRDPSLTSDEIRREFHRVVQLLCVDRQPKRLQAAAASYLSQVQIAFETLIEPYRRAEYDLSLADADTSSPASTDDNATYQASVLEQYMLLGPGGLRTTTDLGMRVDAVSLFDSAGQRTRRDRPLGLGILDYSLRQSITTNLPTLREPFEKTATFLRDLAEKQLSLSPTKTTLHCTDPTITITGSTHGLLDESFKLASLLRDPYQPPGPSIHGRRRLEQLTSSRFLPLLNITTRQEIFLTQPPQTPHSSSPPPTTVLEQELDLLPLPSLTLRAGHTLTLPSTQQPLNLEISLQTLLPPSHTTPPTLGLALDHPLGPGTAFLVLDAGTWSPSPQKECLQLSKFSQISQTRITTPTPNPFINPPTLEAGYAFGSHAMGVRSSRAFTKPSERGLQGMDHDCIIPHNPTPASSSAPSWTISTGLTFGNAAAYLRYGTDLFTSSSSGPPPPATAPLRKSGFRAEIELASTTAIRRDLLIAFRTLKYIGRFSKIGLEVGLTANNLHLSLYWSRLGQRVSIPFLVATTGRSSRLVFWTTVVPFVGMAVWEGWGRGLMRGRGKGDRKGKKGGLKGEGNLKGDGREKERVEGDIARQRAEADELTGILATGVEGRQRGERQRGGLVVLSAKYGVMDGVGAGGEGENEIADVTVAVASLVDEEGRLRIPGGLEKGRLLGFWDPSPGVGRGKRLWVRYLWRGKEVVVEVGEGEGISLP